MSHIQQIIAVTPILAVDFLQQPQIAGLHKVTAVTPSPVKGTQKAIVSLTKMNLTLKIVQIPMLVLPRMVLLLTAHQVICPKISLIPPQVRNPQTVDLSLTSKACHPLMTPRIVSPLRLTPREMDSRRWNVGLGWRNASRAATLRARSPSTYWTSTIPARGASMNSSVSLSCGSHSASSRAEDSARKWGRSSKQTSTSSSTRTTACSPCCR